MSAAVEPSARPSGGRAAAPPLMVQEFDFWYGERQALHHIGA